uniref:Uncharacterized protein n=1 Tax=Candidatus Methanogaster sp. ANME-2c ERB4 TaxID=2759911 RepID=A0A7G9Y199_9EURY|nr:hypothetical protein PIKABMHP_00024 [Methanosarcinales archaeon ANME-2c ERB4]
MNVKLSELELRVISLLGDSRTMGELAERASVTRGYIWGDENSPHLGEFHILKPCHFCSFFVTPFSIDNR